MNIYEFLKKDHKAVSQLFEKLETEQNDVEKATATFKELKTNLAAHSKAEEEVFYSPLKKASKDAVEITTEGDQEHHVIGLLLMELSRLTVNTTDWKAKLHVLKEIVEHHVEEEESETFAKAKKVFSEDEAEEICVKMQAKKTEYMPQADDILKKHKDILLEPTRFGQY